MAAAESARRDALRSVTIADLAGDVESDSGKGTLAGVGVWLASSEGHHD
jgi:hypothetical protein